MKNFSIPLANHTARLPSSNLGRGGDAGFVTINTKNLFIRDGGQASVQAVGSQNAGDLDIRATNATLDNGTITAQTESGSLGIGERIRGYWGVENKVHYVP